MSISSSLSSGRYSPMRMPLVTSCTIAPTSVMSAPNRAASARSTRDAGRVSPAPHPSPAADSEPEPGTTFPGSKKRIEYARHYGGIQTRAIVLASPNNPLPDDHIPYITHLMGTMTILARLGATDEILAELMNIVR